MPAKGIFALGSAMCDAKRLVLAIRRLNLPRMQVVETITLTNREWRVLTALKREFAPEEIQEPAWNARAAESGMSLENSSRSRNP